MKTILVSYDLRSPGRDYEPLWDHLRSYPDYIKPLESLWFLKTNYSAKEVRELVKGHTDSNDRLMVVDVTGDAAAWDNLTNAQTQWLKDNL